MNRVVFLDRDGTIIEDCGFLTKPEDLKLLPNAASAIRTLNESGFKVIVITNQPVIGRGTLSHEGLKKIHEQIEEMLKQHGARIDSISYCPHLPEENCRCRKPEPSMLLAAADKMDIDLRHSYMIGDKPIDCEAGRRAGCISLQIHDKFDLYDAAQWILESDTISIQETLDELKGLTVAVIGDIMLDEWVSGNMERISPEAPVPVVEVSEIKHTLGGASNVAKRLKDAGAEPRLVGLIGINGPAIDTINLLSDIGISDEYIVKCPTRRTTVKRRLIVSGVQVSREDYEVTGPVDKDIEAELSANALRAVEHANIVLISDYDKGVVSFNVLRTIIDKSIALGIPVVVDPKGTSYSKYSGCSLIKPNRKEAAAMTGLPETDDVLLVANEMFSQVKCSAIIITRGSEGMSLFLKDGPSVHYPAMDVVPENVVGAGDVASAMICIGKGSLNIDWSMATKLANTIAGLFVEKPALKNKKQ